MNLLIFILSLLFTIACSESTIYHFIIIKFVKAAVKPALQGFIKGIPLKGV